MDAGGNYTGIGDGGSWRAGIGNNSIDTMILEAFLLVAWIQFVNACFWEGHIFGKIGHIMETEIADWVYKPTIGCPICMTPWHGLWAWLIFDIHPLAILLAAGVNVVIIRFTPDES